MPIDRDHAFADGPAFGRPKRPLRRTTARSQKSRAVEAWAQFDRHAQVAAGCLLGPNAWCVNGLAEPARISLAENAVCRGLLRIEKFGSGRIAIGARAWIGSNAIILKGVTIGADSVVTHDVAEATVVAGNPAVVVKKLEHD